MYALDLVDFYLVNSLKMHQITGYEVVLGGVQEESLILEIYDPKSGVIDASELSRDDISWSSFMSTQLDCKRLSLKFSLSSFFLKKNAAVVGDT